MEGGPGSQFTFLSKLMRWNVERSPMKTTSFCGGKHNEEGEWIFSCNIFNAFSSFFPFFLKHPKNLLCSSEKVLATIFTTKVWSGKILVKTGHYVLRKYNVKSILIYDFDNSVQWLQLFECVVLPGYPLLYLHIPTTVATSYIMSVRCSIIDEKQVFDWVKKYLDWVLFGDVFGWWHS